MDVERIKEVIKRVVLQEIECKSVLIDGSWGCGKTTVVNQALKELKNDSQFKKKKVIYQSLFGVKDVSELTGCYNAIGNALFRVGKSASAPFIKLIPFVGDQICEFIDNVTESYHPGQKKKKKTIFIFDDLERTDYSFSYLTLLGLFNQLVMRGCTIICVSSLSNMSAIDKKNERDRELHIFAEKAFDRIFYINESPDNIILKIFDNDETKQYASEVRPNLSMFDGNIRLASKVKRLLIDIDRNQKNKGYDLKKKYSNQQIVKSTICAIRSIYSITDVEKKPKEKSEDESMKKIMEHVFDMPNGSRYSNIIKMVSNEIKENSFFYSSEDKETIKELAIDFCCVELNDDYAHLINVSGERNKKTTLDKRYASIFYLGDEDKRKAFIDFKNRVINNDFEVDRQFMEQVVEFIQYTDFDLTSDGLFDCIVEAVAMDEIKNGNSEALNKLYVYLEYPLESRDEKAYKNVKKIYDAIMSIIKNNTKENIQNSVELDIKHGNYRDLLDLLYDVSNYKKPRYVRDAFDSLLAKNNFYMPNLSETLDYEEWSYCHAVAKYVKNDEQKKKLFIQMLKDQITKNPLSKSAIEKAVALVQYNFGKESLEEFKAFLNSLNLN